MPMKYIRRISEPQGLVILRETYSKWGDTYPDAKIKGKTKLEKTIQNDSEARSNIKDTLLKMQNGLCAYCEMRIAKKEQAHIEHFYPVSLCSGKKSKKQFEWSNLFASCNNQQNCGKYKGDRDISDALKPDDEILQNSEEIFYYNDLGEVFANTDISADLNLRVRKTIDIFNLNSPSLVRKRKEVFSLIGLNFAAYIESGAMGIEECADVSVKHVKNEMGFDSFCDFWKKRPKVLASFCGEKCLRYMLKLEKP